MCLRGHHALVLLNIGFGLLHLPLLWLPDEALVAIFGDEARNGLMHRAHHDAGGIMAWAMLPPLVVQLRESLR